MHRYTFAAGAHRHILMDLRSSIYNYPGKVLWSRVRIREDGTVTGMRETRGWAPGRQLYFAMRFSAAVSGHALYDREENPPPYRGFKTPGTSPQDTQSIEGRGIVAVFDFAPASDPLIVKVALSPVSEDNAIANMDAETPGFDFDGVRAKTQQTVAQGTGPCRNRRLTRDAKVRLYRAVSRDDGSEYEHGCEWRLSRTR